MRKIYITTLLILTVIFLHDGNSFAQPINETPAETPIMSAAAEIPIPASSPFIYSKERSNIPMGANLLFSAQSILRIEKVSPRSPLPMKASTAPSFNLIPSPAAIMLLGVALLLLPFMGRTESK